MLNFYIFRLININIYQFRQILPNLIVFRRTAFEFKKIPWARGWKDGPPQAESYIHPALNRAGFRPGGLKRLGML
jgi:hypothetical protein